MATKAIMLVDNKNLEYNKEKRSTIHQKNANADLSIVVLNIFNLVCFLPNAIYANEL